MCVPPLPMNSLRVVTSNNYSYSYFFFFIENWIQMKL